MEFSYGNEQTEQLENFKVFSVRFCCRNMGKKDENTTYYIFSLLAFSRKTFIYCQLTYRKDISLYFSFVCPASQFFSCCCLHGTFCLLTISSQEDFKDFSLLMIGRSQEHKHYLFTAVNFPSMTDFVAPSRRTNEA